MLIEYAGGGLKISDFDSLPFTQADLPLDVVRIAMSGRLTPEQGNCASIALTAAFGSMLAIAQVGAVAWYGSAS